MASQVPTSAAPFAANSMGVMDGRASDMPPAFHSAAQSPMGGRLLTSALPTPTRAPGVYVAANMDNVPSGAKRARTSSSISSAQADVAARSASLGVDNSSPHTASDNAHSEDESEHGSVPLPLNGDTKRTSNIAVQRRRLQVREASRRFRERKKQELTGMSETLLQVNRELAAARHEAAAAKSQVASLTTRLDHAMRTSVLPTSGGTASMHQLATMEAELRTLQRELAIRAAENDAAAAELQALRCNVHTSSGAIGAPPMLEATRPTIVRAQYDAVLVRLQAALGMLAKAQNACNSYHQVVVMVANIIQAAGAYASFMPTPVLESLVAAAVPMEPVCDTKTFAVLCEPLYYERSMAPSDELPISAAALSTSNALGGGGGSGNMGASTSTSVLPSAATSAASIRVPVSSALPPTSSTPFMPAQAGSNVDMSMSTATAASAGFLSSSSSSAPMLPSTGVAWPPGSAAGQFTAPALSLHAAYGAPKVEHMTMYTRTPPIAGVFPPELLHAVMPRKGEASSDDLVSYARTVRESLEDVCQFANEEWEEVLYHRDVKVWTRSCDLPVLTFKYELRINMPPDFVADMQWRNFTDESAARRVAGPSLGGLNIVQQLDPVTAVVRRVDNWAMPEKSREFLYVVHRHNNLSQADLKALAPKTRVPPPTFLDVLPPHAAGSSGSGSAGAAAHMQDSVVRYREAEPNARYFLGVLHSVAHPAVPVSDFVRAEIYEAWIIRGVDNNTACVVTMMGQIDSKHGFTTIPAQYLRMSFESLPIYADNFVALCVENKLATQPASTSAALASATSSSGTS